ncbi:MAG: DUF2834 domain-containing protein, partial [Microbacterium sp.]
LRGRASEWAGLTRIAHVGAAEWHHDAMTRDWTPLALVYLLLAVAGLIGTWWFNALAIIQMADFIGDLVTSGPAVSSITVDLLVVAIAGSVFIIVEARRLRMRFGWLYVAAAGLTAFAFTFPLFLAMRERRLTRLARAAS